MAALLTRKRAVYAKAEGTYGVDPTLAASDAMQSANLTVSLEGSAEPLNLDDSKLGTSQSIHVGQHMLVEFDVPLAGSAAAGTAPPYDALLEACHLTGVNTPATDEVYSPDSDSVKSVALECNLDGTQHQILGCRGNATFNLNAGSVPMWHFRFLGLYSAPTAVADPTPAPAGFITPLPVTAVNTPTVSIHSQAFELASCAFDLGNEVVFEQLAGGSPAEEIMIVNRAPVAQVEVRALAVGTFNAMAVAVANTEAAVSIVHGITAGNILSLAGSQVQIIGPSYGDRNGVRMWPYTLQFNKTAGADDDLAITYT